MKSFLKKYRGFLVLGLMMALLTSVFTVDVGAYARNFFTPTSTSATLATPGDRFYLKTEYHIGTQAPWDDAYIYVESGGSQFIYRYQEYYFGIDDEMVGPYSEEHYSILTNMVYDNIGYEIPGKDFGVGYGYARSYNVSGKPISYLDESQKLTIG